MKLDRPKFINFEKLNFPKTDNEHGFDTVELKLDGWWGQLVLEDLDWRIYSRSGQLKKLGKLSRSYGRCILHGEYVYGTEWAKDNAHGMYDKIMLFGAEEIESTDVRTMTSGQVRGILAELVHDLKEAEEPIQNGVGLVPQFHIQDAPGTWDVYVEGENYEGLIFKDSRGRWGKPFGRMKQMLTMDYICTGFEESESETYAGIGVRSVNGGLYVDGELVHKCKVGGLLDEQRMDMLQHPEKYVGRVFEAEGKKLSKKGALRHPNFLRWRDDKNPEECTWKI